MKELLTLSAVEIARRIRQRRVSPVEATQAHIERIREINPRINALVEDRFETALEEARQAEAAVGARADLPPFHGVPCSIKETYAVQGMRHTGGVVRRRERRADRDASAVARYRKAGAIVLGTTNVPEYAMWFETYNKIYGLTRNPHNLRHGVGGSSGGEGALLAAAGAPFGLGSDIGGSIRYPSAFCGVVGHKPTGGLVPGTGHWPDAAGELARFCAYGPMGRRIEDLIALLPILAGPDGEDPSVVARSIPDAASVDPRRLTVYYYEDNTFWPASIEVRAAIRQTVRALEDAGVCCLPWWPRGLRHGLDIWSAMMSLASPKPMSEVWADGGPPIRPLAELAKGLVGKSEHTWPTIGFFNVEPISKWLQARNRSLRRLGQEMQREIEHRLGDGGVLLAPVFPTPAPRHHFAWFQLPGVGYSGLFNVLELPATIVPVDWTDRGLPVSVQVVGKRFNDPLTLRMAGLLEEIFGGWKPAMTE